MKNEPIICPVLRALEHAGELQPEANGQVPIRTLSRALSKLGVKKTVQPPLLMVALFGNTFGNAFKNLRTRSFNPHNMRRGFANHAADTGIMSTGVFNEAQFTSMLAMSGDGETLSFKEMAAVIGADQRRNPSLFGVQLSLVELGSLMAVFGEPDEKTKLPRIQISTLESLYRDGELPKGWRPRKSYGIRAMVSTASKLAAHIPTAPAMVFQKKVPNTSGTAV